MKMRPLITASKPCRIGTVRADF